MTRRPLLGLVILTGGLALALAADATAQGKKSDSVVQVKASADKPGEDGKQVVTVTLEIDPKYHVYANPVGQADFEDNQTQVSVRGKQKLGVKVEYPAGETVKDSVVGDYKVYRGKVAIKAIVQRPKGDTGPLDVAVKVQACSKTSCLLPATIKTSVP